MRGSDRLGVLGLTGLALAAYVAVMVVVGWVGEHPVLSTLVAIALVVGAGFTIFAVRRERRARAAWLAEKERNIATTDGISGAEFEQWVARLMRRTGFRAVTVRGGAGDQGADITATAPDGRWTVVQCKRYSPARSMGSPAVQTFAGPAHGIHKAELAVLVTTTGFTAPARRDAALMNIVLVDRDLLATWATAQVTPLELGGAGPVARAA